MYFSATSIIIFSSLLVHSALAAPNRNIELDDNRFTPSSVVSPLAVTALIIPASAAATPKGPAPIGPSPIVIAIHTITDASTTLDIEVSKVTPKLSVEDITAVAAVTVHSLADIVADIASAIGILQKKPVIGSATADIVVQGLVGFVKVHQALLNTVIGKHSIFAQFALTVPLAAVLRALEAAINVFATGLTDTIPSKKAIIQNQISRLDVTLQFSVSVYSQVCRPSRNFPKIQPTCIKRSA